MKILKSSGRDLSDILKEKCIIRQKEVIKVYLNLIGDLKNFKKTYAKIFKSKIDLDPLKNFFDGVTLNIEEKIKSNTYLDENFKEDIEERILATVTVNNPILRTKLKIK